MPKERALLVPEHRRQERHASLHSKVLDLRPSNRLLLHPALRPVLILHHHKSNHLRANITNLRNREHHAQQVKALQKPLLNNALYCGYDSSLYIKPKRGPVRHLLHVPLNSWTIHSEGLCHNIRPRVQLNRPNQTGHLPVQ